MALVKKKKKIHKMTEYERKAITARYARHPQDKDSTDNHVGRAITSVWTNNDILTTMRQD